MAKITGVSRKRIIAGLKDLAAPPLDPGRVRRKGGGRRPITETDGTIVEDLKHLVEPVTMGDPMRPLMWVSKSQEKLADELVALGHDVSPNTVGRLLVDELAYSRQVNRKTHEGSSHPDRNAQFEHINAHVKAAQAAGQPVISVDTKKKELIGNFRNSGSDYRCRSRRDIRHTTQRSFVLFQRWPPVRRLARSVVIRGLLQALRLLSYCGSCPQCGR